MTAPGPGLSAPPVPFAERWRRIPRRWQVVLVLAGLLAAVELAGAVVGGIGGGSRGAQGTSSSYDATPGGTEAFGQLLSERGRSVARLTTALATAHVEPGTTVFVLDPISWTGADSTAVARLLSEGDTVVFGGRPPAGLQRALPGVGSLPAWTLRLPGDAGPVISPAPEGVTRVIVPGPGSYRPSSLVGGVRPVLAGPAGVLAADVQVGPGTLVLLGSSSCVANESLGHADNAAWALDLAGTGERAVVFDEYDHGYGRPGTSLAGLPGRWRWGLGIALLALGVWLLSASRRFGPPAGQERKMIPPRVRYVDALATALATRPPPQLADVVAPVVTEVRRRAAGGMAPERAAAVADDLAALESAPRTASDIVAAGRLLAQLQREPGR